MNEETNSNSMEEQELILGVEQAFDVIQDTMNTFLEAASVNAVYGQPIENGDTLIIPAAEILSGIGFGTGAGYGPQSAEGEKQQKTGGGGGGGGGGRVLSRPVAVIISSPEGVRVEPVVDATKIALAALTASGFMLAMLARMSNPRKALKNPGM